MARPLLLLHGALYTAREFSPIMQAIGSMWSVLAVDFAGHGGQEFPDAPFSIDLFGRGVIRALDDAGVRSIDIMGYSMGGYVALWLALHHPERVRGIVTLATKLQWNPETAARESAMLDPDRIEAKVPAFAETLAARHGVDAWKDVVRRTAAMLITLGENPSVPLDAARDIPHRVRLMVGDRDQMVSIEETAEFYRALPAGEFAVLPATPHPLEKTRVGAIADAIDTLDEA